MINYVEPALDLETSSDAEARIVKDWLREYLTKAYHGDKRVVDVGHTTYYGPRYVTKTDGRRRAIRTNLVLYPRLSKDFSCVPRCRIEYRFNRADNVRAQGIDTLDDLIHFDHHAFWQKYLRLRKIDYQLYGKDCYYYSKLNREKRNTPIIKEFADGRIKMNVWRRWGYANIYRKHWDAKQAWLKQSTSKNCQDQSDVSKKSGHGKSKPTRHPVFDITAQTFYDYCKLKRQRYCKQPKAIQGSVYAESSLSTHGTGNVTGTSNESDADVLDTGKLSRCLIVIDNSEFLPDSY